MGRRDLDESKSGEERIKDKKRGGKSSKIQMEGLNNHNPNLCGKTS